MALNAITASTDLTGFGKGKRVASWSFYATSAAVITLRDGSATGTPFIQIGIPTVADSKAVSYSLPAGAPLFPNGLYVKVESGVVVGSVDLI